MEDYGRWRTQPSRSLSRASVDAHLALRLGLQRLQRGEHGRARAVVRLVVEDDHLVRDGQRAVGKLLGRAPLLGALVLLDALEELALGGVAGARAALVPVVVRARAPARVRQRARDRLDQLLQLLRGGATGRRGMGARKDKRGVAESLVCRRARARLEQRLEVRGGQRVDDERCGADERGQLRLLVEHLHAVHRRLLLARRDDGKSGW